MTRLRSLTGLTTVLACLALATPAAAHHGCSKHARGGEIRVKTKEAHVYVKNDLRWGCASRVGRPFRLPRLDTVSSVAEFDDGSTASFIRLSGVYVAYERYDVYPAGQETVSDVMVVDLRTGKAVIDEPATDEIRGGDDSVVEALVLKRNGSIGWIGRVSGGDSATFEVLRHSRDPVNPGRARLDAGTDIERGALALSSDRRTLLWNRGGQTKSAPLP